MAVLWKTGEKGKGLPILKFGVQPSTLDKVMSEAEVQGRVTDKGSPTSEFFEDCVLRGVASLARERQDAEASGLADRVTALEQRIADVAASMKKEAGE